MWQLKTAMLTKATFWKPQLKKQQEWCLSRGLLSTAQRRLSCQKLTSRHWARHQDTEQTWALTWNQHTALTAKQKLLALMLRTPLVIKHTLANFQQFFFSAAITAIFFTFTCEGFCKPCHTLENYTQVIYGIFEQRVSSPRTDVTKEESQLHTHVTWMH